MEPVTAEVAQHGLMIFQDGWFEDNFFAWLIFSVGAGAVSAGLTLLVRLVLSLPDRGWVLEMRGYGDAEQAIVPEEAHRFRNSRFELWKFVKSVVSGACLIKGRTIKNAEEHGWFVMEEPQHSWLKRRLRRGCGRIVIDFSKIPRESLASAWYDGPPKNWIGTPKSERTLFVSRHPGARDWLERQGY
ncbi:hypothetical protein [Martelella lutilitoris]|uniref:hypothetical protein n=1 Tax=Martelella lutilitoris TaxID=2583532 RepID=UPI001AEE4B92|nr:hypothetical protein [Martelella lutilitoris]